MVQSIFNQSSILIEGKSNGVSQVVSGQLILLSSLRELSKKIAGKIVIISKKAYTGDSLFLVFSCIKNGARGIVLESTNYDHGIIATKEIGIPTLIISDYKKIPFNNSVKETFTLKDNKLLLGNYPIPQKSVTNDMKKISTKHKVKINLGFPLTVKLHPELAQLSDGVGFCRLEFSLLEVLRNIHPKKYIRTYSYKKLVDELAISIEPIVKSFQDDQVWFRTDDFSSDQLLYMDGGREYELKESNVSMGWRGIRRSILQTDLLRAQFDAINKIVKKGYSRIGIFPPMTISIDEYNTWLKIANSCGLQDKSVSFGLMVETPAAALTIKDFVEKISFVVFGTNDLTQFTLGVDRLNPKLTKLFDENHPAVLKLLKYVIKQCNKNKIETYIVGEGTSNLSLLKYLLDNGISGVSVSPEAGTITNTRKYLHLYEKGSNK